MARSGWSTSNYLRYASGLLTATPLTMACWAKTSVSAATQVLMSLNNSASATDRNEFLLYVRSTDAVSVVTADTAASVASASTTITTGAWFHAAGVFASATSRAAYFNGANKGANSTSRTPSGINQTLIGVRNNAGSFIDPFAPAGAGVVAEAAIWNIALSDADIAALATGASPLLVHPESIVAYWPLIGNNSPENNRLSNTSVMSISGSLSQAAHPRIIMPHRRLVA